MIRKQDNEGDKLHFGRGHVNRRRFRIGHLGDDKFLFTLFYDPCQFYFINKKMFGALVLKTVSDLLRKICFLMS